MNNVVKTLFSVSTEKELHGALDTFLREYNFFNHKNDPFDSNDFIWNSKDITDGNSHLWHQKYSLTSTKVLGFVACRVTSKILGIGSADLFPDLIALTSPHERSADPIRYIFEVTLQATKPRTLVDVNEYF